MYYIRVKYHFYQGTHNAPKNGALRIGLNGAQDLTTEKKICGRPRRIYCLETKEDAIQEIERIVGGIIYKHGGSTYGAYYGTELRHGEYAAPLYTIVKKSKQKGE